LAAAAAVNTVVVVIVINEIYDCSWRCDARSGCISWACSRSRTRRRNIGNSSSRISRKRSSISCQRSTVERSLTCYLCWPRHRQARRVRKRRCRWCCDCRRRKFSAGVEIRARRVGIQNYKPRSASKHIVSQETFVQPHGQSLRDLPTNMHM
jgi:hypothetical protein